MPNAADAIEILNARVVEFTQCPSAAVAVDVDTPFAIQMLLRLRNKTEAGIEVTVKSHISKLGDDQPQWETIDTIQIASGDMQAAKDYSHSVVLRFGQSDKPSVAVDAICQLSWEVGEEATTQERFASCSFAVIEKSEAVDSFDFLGE